MLTSNKHTYANVSMRKKWSSCGRSFLTSFLCLCGCFFLQKKQIEPEYAEDQINNVLMNVLLYQFHQMKSSWHFLPFKSTSVQCAHATPRERADEPAMKISFVVKKEYFTPVSFPNMEVINVKALVLRLGIEKLKNELGCLRNVALHFDGTEVAIDFEGSSKFKEKDLKWKYKNVELVPSRKFGVSYDTIQADGLSLMYAPPQSDKRAQIKRILKPSKSQRDRQSDDQKAPQLTQPPSATPDICFRGAVKMDMSKAEKGNQIHRALGYELTSSSSEGGITLPDVIKMNKVSFIDAAHGVPSLFVFAVEAVANEIRELQKAKIQSNKLLLVGAETIYVRAIEERQAFLSDLPQTSLAKCHVCNSVRSANVIQMCRCGRKMCPECRTEGIILRSITNDRKVMFPDYDWESRLDLYSFL